ncbi:YdeI/OmpD-associated family protein [Sporolactobacillus sp. Y61]|uniref:YdeI/OmpD-associated family protein n=1 Tax=Sporolactobacillus sp. Y61 TaxID=3160863 RepID=A0AAU8ICU4_9BACL
MILIAEKNITDKLRLDRYRSTAVLHLPEKEAVHFNELSGYDVQLQNKKYDLVFAFVFSLDQFVQLVRRIRDLDCLLEKGYLYVAYPKKGNKTYPDFVHRDEIFPALHVTPPEGYIDSSTIRFSRMVSLDATFTIVGMKKDSASQGQPSTKPSQRVNDYISYIPYIESRLADKPALSAFFSSLTPGYRKDWARYIYSAKRESTQKKRFSEMEMILDKGFKSKDLYRRSRS